MPRSKRSRRPRRRLLEAPALPPHSAPRPAHLPQRRPPAAVAPPSPGGAACVGALAPGGALSSGPVSVTPAESGDRSPPAAVNVPPCPPVGVSSALSYTSQGQVMGSGAGTPTCSSAPSVPSPLVLVTSGGPPAGVGGYTGTGVRAHAVTSSVGHPHDHFPSSSLYSAMGFPCVSTPQVVWSAWPPGVAQGLSVPPHDAAAHRSFYFGASSQPLSSSMVRSQYQPSFLSVGSAGPGGMVFPAGRDPSLPVPTTPLLSPLPCYSPGASPLDMMHAVPLSEVVSTVAVAQEAPVVQRDNVTREVLPPMSAPVQVAEATSSWSAPRAEDPGASGAGEHDVSSSSSSSPASNKHSRSPHRLRKFAKLVAREMAKKQGARKAKKAAASAEPPLHPETVLCANTALTRGLRNSARRKILKGKYVNVFTLKDDMYKEYKKAKKEGEAAEDAFRDFPRWMHGFLVFSYCYLETRPEEHLNVLKYMFLINQLFMEHKGTYWRDYDEKFRKYRDGNPTLPFGFKDVEVWLEVMCQGEKSEGLAIRSPSAPVSNSQLQLYTDAAGATGFGAYFQGDWCFAAWPPAWRTQGFTANSLLLELFPIIVGAELWASRMANQSVIFWCDNLGVVQAINNQQCSSPHALRLLQYLVVHCLRLNISFTARHVPGAENGVADALSRGDFVRFRALAPGAADLGLTCPPNVWQIVDQA